MTATNIASRRRSLVSRRCSAGGSSSVEPNSATFANTPQHHPRDRHCRSGGGEGREGRSEEEWKQRYDELNDTIATLTLRLSALKKEEQRGRRGAQTPISSASSNTVPVSPDSAEKRASEAASELLRRREISSNALNKYYRVVAQRERRSTAVGRSDKSAAAARQPASASEVATLPRHSVDVNGDGSGGGGARRYRPSRRYDLAPASAVASSASPTVSVSSRKMSTRTASRSTFEEDEDHRRKYSSSAAADCAAAYASRYEARSSAWRTRRESRNCLAASTSRSAIATAQASSTNVSSGPGGSGRAAMIVARMRSRARTEQQQQQQQHEKVHNKSEDVPPSRSYRTERIRRGEESNIEDRVTAGLTKNDLVEQLPHQLLKSTSDGSSSTSETSTTCPLEQDEREIRDEDELQDGVGELLEATPDRHSRGRRARAASMGMSPSNAASSRRPSLKAQAPPPHSRTNPMPGGGSGSPRRMSTSSSASSSTHRRTHSGHPMRKESSMLLGNSWMIDQPNSALGKLCRGCHFHRCACVEREQGDWGVWVRIDEPTEGVTLPRDVVCFMPMKRGD